MNYNRCGCNNNCNCNQCLFERNCCNRNWNNCGCENNNNDCCCNNGNENYCNRRCGGFLSNICDCFRF